MLNSHAFDNMSISSPIYITDTVRSTPINFSIDLATDADTAAVSRTFDNETFTLENLRTDLGDFGFDSKGYIHATNGLKERDVVLKIGKRVEKYLRDVGYDV